MQCIQGGSDMSTSRECHLVEMSMGVKMGSGAELNRLHPDRTDNSRQIVP